MPVTFRPVAHPANEHSYEYQKPINSSSAHLDEICSWTGRREVRGPKEILQSSFPDFLPSQGDDGPLIIASDNGLFSALGMAYNMHHAVSIRPDDVCLAILAQFSFYVNAHAEALRDKFVEHQGKKKLEVREIGNRYSVDWGKMVSVQMKKLLVESLRDPSVADRIVPKFTTTTWTDEVAGAVMLLATMKKYFTYKSYTMCGIPQVTLEGEKADWEDMLSRLEKLKGFDAQAVAEEFKTDKTDLQKWYTILKPVLEQFIKAFDDPNGEDNPDFWNRICSRESFGSGMDYYSGWITAFSAFDTDGRWILRDSSSLADLRKKALSEIHSYDSNGGFHVRENPDFHKVFSNPYLLSTGDVTPAYVEIDILPDDNGEEMNTVMLSGMVGYGSEEYGNKSLSQEGKADLLKPVPGWWIYVKKDQ